MRRTIPGVILMVACSVAWAGEAGITIAEFDGFDVAKNTYPENCAMCHGYDGQPMLPDVPNFAKGERLEKSNDELMVIMKAGKGLMPAWEGVFDEGQQRSLLDFTRGISGDGVFEERCDKCHSRSVPALGKMLPKTRQKLMDHEGDLNVCSGHDIEKTMSRQELADVVTYLRTLEKFRK